MRYSNRMGLAIAALVGLLGTASSVSAEEIYGAPSYDWHACADEARRLEIQENIPKLLLTAVTFTETGRRGPYGRQIMSWPWTLHAEGKSLHFQSKVEAANAVRALMARGVKNIDVGCMQINLRYHPHAFTSVEEALDPMANLAYGVTFLKHLEQRHNGWPAAIQNYHSANRAVNQRYRRKVFAIWDQLRRRQERARIRNGTSVLASSEQQNEQSLGARASKPKDTAVLARRESRKSWTVQSNQLPQATGQWRDSLLKTPLQRLPFKEQRPHAQIVVALERWTSPKDEQKHPGSRSAQSRVRPRR